MGGVLQLYEKQFNQDHRDLANIPGVLMRVNILLHAGGENEIMMVRSRRTENKPSKTRFEILQRLVFVYLNNETSMFGLII